MTLINSFKFRPNHKPLTLMSQFFFRWGKYIQNNHQYIQCNWFLWAVLKRNYSKRLHELQFWIGLMKLTESVRGIKTSWITIGLNSWLNKLVSLYSDGPFKGVMNWEIKFFLSFWHLRGHHIIRISCTFQNWKRPC